MSASTWIAFTAKRRRFSKAVPNGDEIPPLWDGTAGERIAAVLMHGVAEKAVTTETYSPASAVLPL